MGIVGFHPRWNEGTVAERRGQIAGLASLPAGRGATNPVSAESGLALVIAATGFGLPLGLADRARRACTGRPDIRTVGVGVRPPTIYVGRVGIVRATSSARHGGQDKNAQEGTPTVK